MKTINLTKINTNSEIDFDELYRMLKELGIFLEDEINPEDQVWMENFNTILNFQEEDGSFKLLDTHFVPSDQE